MDRAARIASLLLKSLRTAYQYYMAEVLCSTMHGDSAILAA
jgi:hypothetical protein